MKPVLIIGSVLVSVAVAVTLLGRLVLFSNEEDSASPPPTPSVLVVATPRVVFSAHADEITCLAVAPSGDGLATASVDGTLQVWRGTTGELRHALVDRAAQCDCLVFSPDGQRLAAGCRDGSVRLWDVSSGAERARFGPHLGFVWSVAFTPDGRTLAATSGDLQNEGYPGEIKLWDLNTSQAHTLPLPRQAMHGLALSPNGRTLAAGLATQRDLVLCDLATGQERSRRPSHAGGFLRLAYAPNGRWLASASSSGMDETIALWHADTGEELRRVRGIVAGCKALAWSPDGRLLAAAARHGSVCSWEGELWLIEPDASGPVRRLHVPESRVQALAFTPDGAQLLAGCSDGCVRMWDVTTLNF